ncbi:AdoMet-dependent rRNA methyltransferase spb1 [Histomonas meleagridis]|uniref:AdoMet-dependent rRNA methyltransferase spb1 n=1 Tax=Histomonas meleagridis TaxID=135588 RepID=UPI0035599F47|nr:AdoMet-dependent rRNA methyltransferase spb1 [Histomonas meleagridis]KAH0798021.1 AdoMet-dependent rRNA methyltransferase spb1 [Histomonas meleagridis]
MGKTRAYKHRLDKYYHLAHAVGYRSRAAFKLIQLNQQFDFLSNSHCCLDLCAAPGGWSQVAAKYMPPDSMIISIDLSPIRPIPRVTTLQADILSPKTHAKVRKLIQGNRADLILNDGAPNVGAAWITDSTNQLDLCLASVKFSTLFLRKGGTFVTKVFRSEHYNSLLWVLNQFFEQVIPTKPKASRDSSAELFIVCKDYKAPTVIDPRLLDPQYVFTDLDELTAKAAPNAQLTTSTAMDFTECTVSDFLKAEKPLDILDVINVLKFDNGPLGTAAASHPATTAEIKELCKDIKVLGRADRKVLLKWRRTMREALIKGTEIQEPAEDIDSDDIGSDEEIKQALETIRQKRRKEEKAERKRREKLRVQLLKRLQKNTENKPVNADMLDPQIRYGKIYTPDIPEEEEDPNKTYEQIMEENIDYYEAHKDKTPISNDEDGVYIGPVKFARHVEIVEPEEPTQVKSKKWFSQSIFNEDDDDEYSSAVDEDENNDKEEVESEEVETEAEEEAQEKAAQVAEEESSKLMGQTSKDFDATAYKMAKELLLHPNRRQDIINDSFNKYLHDDGDIPEWFASDEKRYNRPMIPLSKDDVLAWRQHMRDINQVATKRVIEARARKKKKALQRMKSLQEKADEIAEKEGLNERSKLRIMERIFERGMKSMKPAPKVVVTQKRDAGRPNLPKGVSSGRVKIVDKRFKKDLRGQKASAKRTEGGFQRKKKSVYRHSRKK